VKAGDSNLTFIPHPLKQILSRIYSKGQKLLNCTPPLLLVNCKHLNNRGLRIMQ